MQIRFIGLGKTGLKMMKRLVTGGLQVALEALRHHSGGRAVQTQHE